jgi:uncharacterized membrane protein
MSSEPVSAPRRPGGGGGRNIVKALLRIPLAALFVTAGVLHFRIPDGFAQAVPPYLPSPLALVYISGVFEILGGVGLLIPRLRRAAGWGLIALLIAVFPANLHMALNDVQPPNFHVPTWALWARLPLQGVLIAWVYWCSQES